MVEIRRGSLGIYSIIVTPAEVNVERLFLLLSGLRNDVHGKLQVGVFGLENARVMAIVAAGIIVVKIAANLGLQPPPSVFSPSRHCTTTARSMVSD